MSSETNLWRSLVAFILPVLWFVGYATVDKKISETEADWVFI